MHANTGEGDGCTKQPMLNKVCIWVNFFVKITELPKFLQHFLAPVHGIRGHKYEHKQNIGNVIV